MARPRVFDPDEALAKAMILFWQQGYCATSLENLEAAMGLKRQSIYNVFGDKRSLFLKALRFYRQQGVEFIQQQLTRFKSPKAALHNMIQVLAQGDSSESQPYGCFMANTALELSDHDPEIAQEISLMFEQLEDCFTRVIERGQAQREISQRFESRALAKFLINSVNGFRILDKTHPSKAAIADLVAVTLSVLDA
jgi:TetR/AcrR family transcriptional regulator, transcriptional repressor for nem operon